MKKEYLAKVNGIYRIVEDHEVVSGRIEIPEDADCLVGYNQKLEDSDWSTHWFGKIKNGLVNEIHEDHESSYYNTVEGLVERGQMLWQRQPENQKPLDDVKWLEGDLKEADAVNQPNHYANFSIECIDAMQAMLSKDEFIGYLRGNIFKYNWRYKLKNGVEDLKKAQWYQNKLIEVEENE